MKVKAGKKASSKGALSFRESKHPSIEVDICGFQLKSPTMLASGVLGISFDLFPRIIRSGAGAIVTKSIGLEPREGYPNPTMTGTDAGYLNAIGLANPGAAEFSRELEQGLKVDLPLIVSVFADTEDHFAEIVKALDAHNFLAYELNLSCPHVKQVGSEIGSTPEDAANVVRKTRQETSKPILAKMPASIIDAKDWTTAVQSAGADAIVAINTVRAMKIDVDSRKPILSNKIGGLSGPAMRPIAVRCVYEAFESVKIPVVGVGGISTWRDAVEFFLAGARAIQIGSTMATDYLKTFSEINSGLEEYLRRNGFSSIREIIGLAHS